jgi:hypothetical protein
MIDKIDKIQRLLVVENAYPDIETAKANIKALNILADLKAEAEQLILSGVSHRRELLLDYTKQLKKQGTLTSGQDEGKLVKKFLSNNCG